MSPRQYWADHGTEAREPDDAEKAFWASPGPPSAHYGNDNEGTLFIGEWKNFSNLTSHLKSIIGQAVLLL
jgi:hypothetical protein